MFPELLMYRGKHLELVPPCFLWRIAESHLLRTVVVRDGQGRTHTVARTWVRPTRPQDFMESLFPCEVAS